MPTDELAWLLRRARVPGAAADMPPQEVTLVDGAWQSVAVFRSGPRGELVRGQHIGGKVPYAQILSRGASHEVVCEGQLDPVTRRLHGHGAQLRLGGSHWERGMYKEGATLERGALYCGDRLCPACVDAFYADSRLDGPIRVRP